MADETKVTTKEVKAIADKVAIINNMLNEIKSILDADNYDTFLMRTPMTISLPLPDLIDLARVCRKKPEARAYWGDYIVSFSIYGCIFDSSYVQMEELKHWLGTGAVTMKGEKK